MTNNSPSKNPPSLPTEQSLASIAHLLLKQDRVKDRNKKLAPVKAVLSLLGTGAAISAAILVPNSGRVIAPMIRNHHDWDQWKHFNPSYLRRTLRRLREQKHVEVATENGQEVLRLTSGGKRKILRYSLDSLTIDKPTGWDRKWRLVLYDVPKKSKKLGDVIRGTLGSLGFYGIQESVYIYPYPCFKQIEFLREYYGLGDHVQYMLVDHIENDTAYKTYFNLS